MMRSEGQRLREDINHWEHYRCLAGGREAPGHYDHDFPSGD